MSYTWDPTARPMGTGPTGTGRIGGGMGGDALAHGALVHDDVPAFEVRGLADVVSNRPPPKVDPNTGKRPTEPAPAPDEQGASLITPTNVALALGLGWLMFRR